MSKKAKHVSQVTFDAVVKENMEDFEMTAEDAMADAVKQFEAQGVITADIVQDARVYTVTDGVTPAQPVVAAVSALAVALSGTATDAICACCRQLTAECSDIARRCLAGKHDAYPAIMQAMGEVTASDDIVTVLSTLNALCDGQPDLLDTAGVKKLILLLHSSIDRIVQATADVVNVFCVKHEGNRQSFVDEGVIVALTDALKTTSESPGVVTALCSALRGLMRDDDVRVPFGKTYDHAVVIVSKTKVLETVIGLCKAHPNKVMQCSAIALLAALAVRAEFCQQISDLGGVTLLIAILSDSPTHKELIYRTLTAIKTIAGNDAVKASVVEAGGLDLVLATMRRHELQPSVVESALAALAALVLRAPTHASRLVDCDGAELVTHAMELHQTDEKVQKHACMVIRNTVVHHSDHSAAFRGRGVEPLIRGALQGGAGDEATAALRDLGCRVELKERWTGTGRQLAH